MEFSKAEKMKAMLLKKKKCDKIAMDIVTHLIEPHVEKDYLLNKACLIHPAHWDDVVEERKISGVCGWVLCNHSLQAPPRQQYIIRNNRVLDITDRKSYCSSQCYGASQHFRQQIPDSPLWLREDEPKHIMELVDECSRSKLAIDGVEVSLSKLQLDSSSSSDSDLDAEQKTSNDINHVEET